MLAVIHVANFPGRRASMVQYLCLIHIRWLSSLSSMLSNSCSGYLSHLHSLHCRATCSPSPTFCCTCAFGAITQAKERILCTCTSALHRAADPDGKLVARAKPATAVDLLLASQLVLLLLAEDRIAGKCPAVLQAVVVPSNGCRQPHRAFLQLLAMLAVECFESL